MTRFQRKTALTCLYAVLSPDSSAGGARCPEPELVMEHAILETVLGNPHTLLLLQSLGLEVEPSLVADREGDTAVSTKAMKTILAGGRNSCLRGTSVEHAATVATELGLVHQHFGHLQRLKDAIG